MQALPHAGLPHDVRHHPSSLVIIIMHKYILNQTTPFPIASPVCGRERLATPSGLLGHMQSRNVDMTNENYFSTAQTPEHTQRSPPCVGVRGKDQRSVQCLQRGPSLVITCSLWCVLTTSMTFQHWSSKLCKSGQTFPSSCWWCNAYIQCWEREWSGSPD